MKEIWNFIKNLWQNKRTRSLAILLLYCFFFIFVYFFISANQSTTKPPIHLTGWDAFLKENRYHIQIMKEEEVQIVSDGDIKIIYQDKEYDTNSIPDGLENYFISFWDPSKLKEIVDKATLISTNYIEHKDTYQLSNTDVLPWDENYDIMIEVYKKEDMIYKITMEQKNIPFYLEWEVKE